MKAMEPQLDAPMVTMAEGQDEYLPIRAACVNHPDFKPHPTGNTRVMAFMLEPEEREALHNGELIYLSLLTFGHPMNPLILSVGKRTVASIYNVKAK